MVGNKIDNEGIKKGTLVHTLIGQNAGQHSSIFDKGMPKGLVPNFQYLKHLNPVTEYEWN